VTVTRALPENCGVAFKEWASVCAALLDGRQTIILRKGGISEDQATGVFAPEHPEFWLYPTWVHQASQGVRDGEANAAVASEDGCVPIDAMVQVERLGYIENESALTALESQHILTAETVLKRFHYRRPGLWVLLARVWRGRKPYSIPVTPEHAGCKTWVKLDAPLSTSGLEPCCSDAAWSVRLKSLDVVLGGAIS
jgi:hypothetical protein